MCNHSNHKPSDKEKIIGQVVDVVTALNRLAMVTTDLEINDEWLAQTVRHIRDFRVELNVRIDKYLEGVEE